jgi:hypothetical protein
MQNGDKSCNFNRLLYAFNRISLPGNEIAAYVDRCMHYNLLSPSNQRPCIFYGKKERQILYEQENTLEYSSNSFLELNAAYNL